ncbi:REP-associated tyrosine transposase [Defluviimonas salinarum]|uniref:Transposase n=1 Tax=Defluviimonas salinarum TaxID=2992147 RepID=A0ABT3J995_9RHOB|nr:transposase [Defluviimonas salinarum]MCW3784263.1 transposase [Defluviimonas salinarum]
MPRYRRPRVPGATIFFTVALGQRGSGLLVREVGRLREAVAITRGERPFGIDAFVVMPDHVHCVWTLPEGDADYSVRCGAIKARFTRGLPAGRTRESHEALCEKGIWQRRYWEHHIRDEADYVAHVRYCWINPVKYGFVGKPTDWPYSSIHRDIKRGLVAPEGSGMVPEGDFGE